MRSLSGRRLGREARKLRDKGVDLLLIQPTEQDLDAMGVNLMDPSRRTDVLETSLSTSMRRMMEPDAKAVIAKLRRAAAAAG